MPFQISPSKAANNFIQNIGKVTCLTSYSINISRLFFFSIRLSWFEELFGANMEKITIWASNIKLFIQIHWLTYYTWMEGAWDVATNFITWLNFRHTLLSIYVVYLRFFLTDEKKNVTHFKEVYLMDLCSWDMDRALSQELINHFELACTYLKLVQDRSYRQHNYINPSEVFISREKISVN